MIETKQQEIGGRGYVYHVTQFGARHGGRVLVRLLKMIGGVAGVAIEGASINEAEDPEAVEASALISIGMSTAGKMISNLAKTVSEEDYDYLIDTFAKNTSVQGGSFANLIPLAAEGVFDLHFAGEYAELGQWLLFAVEANFGAFLGEGGLVQKAKAAVGERRASRAVAGASPSLSTSPNTSAASG